MVLIFCLLNVLAIAAYLLGRRLASRGTGACVTATGLCMAIVLLKVLFITHPAVEAAMIQWTGGGAWLGYGYLQRYFQVPVVMLGLGVVIPNLPPRWNRNLIRIMVLTLAAWGVSLTLGLLQGVPGSEKRPDQRHHLQQSTPFTCGPAAGASALSYVGVIETERDLAEMCLTSRAGTTEFCIWRGISLALKGKPYAARVVEGGADDLLQNGRVAIVRLGREHHVVCVRGTGNGVVMHDPLLGDPAYWCADQFRAQYGGVAVVIGGI